MAASAYHFTPKNVENQIFIHTWARPRTQKTRKSQKTRKFFSEKFKSEFSILAVGQNRKLGNKKTPNNISNISEISEFRLATFTFFKKHFCFFNILQQVISYFLSMLCFALFSKPFKVFFPSPKIYVQNITLS